MVVHLIINGGLWGFFFGLMRFTKAAGVLDRKEKNIYQFGIVGLPLVIGLHTAVSLELCLFTSIFHSVINKKFLSNIAHEAF